MKFRSPFLLAFTLAVCLAVTASSARAQGTDLGTLRGVVTDASGALVPDARVRVVDAQTNRAVELTTNAQGLYQAVGLRSGTYNIVVTKPGFSTEQLNGIALAGSSSVDVNAILKVSATKDTVVITDESPVVHTDDQTISQTLTNREIVDLPRDSRDIYSFLYLNPNITQGASDGSFKFIGSQSYGASFSLDGQRANGGIFGDHTASQPPIDAVGELNVLSNDFSAEYAGIANIRITTKRGGADYHGSMFYQNKNSALAAWKLQDKIGQANFVPNFFQSKYPNPNYNENNIGGTFGGPVPLVKNTYLFVAYEKDYVASPVQFYSNTLPHPLLYTGDFSLLKDSVKPAVPAGTPLSPDEIAGDTVGGLGKQFIRIPSRLLNPVVQNLINGYFPHVSTSAPINPSNGRLVNYANLLPGLSAQDLGTVRLDHDFSSKDRAYVVYNVSDQGSHTSPVVSPFTGLGLTQNDRLNHTVSASYTRVITPNIVNEARGGFNQQNLLRHSNQTLGQFLTGIGFTKEDVAAYGAVAGAYALDTFGHPAVFFGTGFQNFTNGGRNTFRPLDQKLVTFGDTFTWIKGSHAVKAGGDLVRNAAVDGFAFNRGNPRGRINYTGKGPDAFASFLLGLPPNNVSYVNSIRPPMDVYNWEQGYFVQDDWKITPRLTLNLGLRYELVTPFVDKNDLLANFDPNFTDKTTGQPGRFVIPSTRTLQYLDPRIVSYGYVTADKIGLGRGLVHPDKNDWAPRVGLAWRVTDRTVIRGGWGLYYPTSAAQGIRDPIATNPFNQSLTKRTVDPNNPLQGWPGFTHGISPLTGGSLQGFGSTPSVNVVPFDLHQPRIQQYNATVERELGWNTSIRASYLGTYMSGLVAGVDLNELHPSDTPFGTTTGDGTTICDPSAGNCDYSAADKARYRFPALGDFVYSFGNFGHGRSNAFQTQVDHRFSGGLLFMFSYTLLSQKSTGLDTGNSSLGGTAYNTFQPNADYGEDSFISRHRIVAYGIYDLPVGHGRKYGSSFHGVPEALLGGWQTAFNLFAKSGTDFTPFWLCDNCGPAYPGNTGVGSVDAVGDFNNGSFRPVVLDNNYAKRVGDRIFNPDSFAPPPVGADLFSNPAVAKRNLLQGPGTWGVNLGVHKWFQIGERVRAEFGADANNVFNHPLFSPDSGYGGGGGPFALVGDFNIAVNPTTGRLLPITDITRNPDFGRLINSFTQEGIDSRRTIRLRLKVVF